MDKIVHTVSNPGQNGAKYLIFCPGCQCCHGWNDRWTYDPVSITVYPSLLVNKDKVCPDQPVCHSFIRNGQISFLSDSTHALAGQTVPLEPF